jgi:uncharacterized membrane protein HdeD (DUF308 family)
MVTALLPPDQDYVRGFSMSNKQTKIQRYIQKLTFGNTMYRGIIAMALGIVLIIHPTKTENMLVNTMGYFWLGSGFALMRNPHTEKTMGKPISWGIGLVAVLTGLLVVTRDITRRWVPEIAVIELLGVAILITGVVHMFEQFKLGQVLKRRAETLDFMLGIFEIFLGLLLISSPLGNGPATYWIATVWALLFGNMIIANGFAQRGQKAEEKKVPGQQDRPTSVSTSDEGQQANNEQEVPMTIRSRSD